MAFSLNRWLWKGLIWAAAGAVGIILLFDVDGWGSFAWSWGAPLFVQAVSAAILAGLFLAIVRIISSNLFSLCLSRPALLLLLVVTASAALPFVSSVFDRPLDMYDGIQTVVLAVIWAFLTQPIRRLLKRFEPASARLAIPLQRESARRPAQPAYAPQSAPPEPESMSYSDEGLYRRLLSSVGGDRAKAKRLIDFEHTRAPYAGRDECIQRALDSLAHDRRW
jgi:hypothetical protein